MRRNYHTKLSASKLSREIITQNYDLVYYVAQKCLNYRVTEVSKKGTIIINGLANEGEICKW